MQSYYYTSPQYGHYLTHAHHNITRAVNWLYLLFSNQVEASIPFRNPYYNFSDCKHQIYYYKVPLNKMVFNGRVSLETNAKLTKVLMQTSDRRHILMHTRSCD